MKKRKDKRIEGEYWEEVEVTNPKTGKVSKQRVKITKYKMLADINKSKGVLEELEDTKSDISVDTSDD